MSENYLIFIPTTPEYVPGLLAQEKACEMVASSLPLADEVICQVTAEMRFIGGGDNLEKITCPHCTSEIDMDWWIKAVDESYDSSQFKNLEIMAPCCDNRISLNELHYELPAGFARFSLEARNPVQDVNQNTINILEKILDCRLRKIWFHL